MRWLANPPMEGKDCLTVLDFIDAANRKYSFEDKKTSYTIESSPLTA